MRIAFGYLRVRAGDTHSGNAAILKGVGCGDRNARAVGSEDDRAAGGNKGLRRGGSLGVIGTVIGGNQLYLIFGIADRHGRNLFVCVLDTEHFLLTARAVIAGLRLENTDLDYVCVGGVLAAVALNVGIVTVVCGVCAAGCHSRHQKK